MLRSTGLVETYVKLYKKKNGRQIVSFLEIRKNDELHTFCKWRIKNVAFLGK